MAINQLNQLSYQLVRGYQRFISPYKGFSCPSGILHGDTTCSAAVRDIVRDQGLVAGLPAIRSQLQRCQQASHTLTLRGDPRAQVFCCVLPIPL